MGLSSPTGFDAEANASARARASGWSGGRGPITSSSESEHWSSPAEDDEEPSLVTLFWSSSVDGNLKPGGKVGPMDGNAEEGAKDIPLGNLLIIPNIQLLPSTIQTCPIYAIIYYPLIKILTSVQVQ